MKITPFVSRLGLLALIGFSRIHCSAESPQVSADRSTQQILAQAPKPNIVMPGMQLELVDFIDCTSSSESHPFKDDGWSSVASGSAGLKYRETAPTAHSFFSYQFNTAGNNLPHLVVVEYPNDKERVCNISFLEEWVKVKYNAGDPYLTQAGYYTGDELPTSGKNCYQKLIFWPSSKTPAVLILNGHNTMPAAASRIWVYNIVNGPKPAEINEPSGARRSVGSFTEDFRGIRGEFGHEGNSIEHLMDYLKYSGQNLLALDSVIYNWSYCKLNAFSAPSNDMTETILSACDKNDIQFVAVLDPTPGFQVNGNPTGNLNDEKTIHTWVDAMKEFVEHYGKHPSLKGISFGGPALGGPTIVAAKQPSDREKIGELHQEINKMLQEVRPDLTLYFFGSNRCLHHSIFNDEGHQPYKDIIAPWEKGKATFSERLVDNVKQYFTENHINPVDFTNRKGLSVVREFYPNDHRLYHFYPYRTNNYMIYLDYAQQESVSELFQNGNQGGACLFGTYFEIKTPLFSGINYWWDYSGVFAQINPAEPYYKEVYTNALAQEDVSFILNASWCTPTEGSADLVREFATSFRTLPAEKFRTVAKDNYVVVRELTTKEGSYFYILNNHWSPADVALTMGNPVHAVNLVTKEPVSVGPQNVKFRLKPYELLTFKMDRANPVTQTAVVRSPESYAHLRQRLEEFNNRYQRLVANHVPVSPRYQDVYNATKDLLDKGKFEQADLTLGHALSQELLLRLSVAVDKSKVICCKVDHPITLDSEGRSGTANTVQFGGMPNLVHDYTMLNQWHGSKDLECKAILNHDGENFYVRFFITDDRLVERDTICFQFARNGFDSTSEGVTYSKTYDIPAPVSSSTSSGRNYVVRKTDTGYEGVFSVPLKELNTKPAEKIGLHINVTDMDLDPEKWFDKASKGFLMPWIREKAMEWPANPYWCSWRDAQSCGEVTIQAQ